MLRSVFSIILYSGPDFKPFLHFLPKKSTLGRNRDFLPLAKTGTFPLLKQCLLHLVAAT